MSLTPAERGEHAARRDAARARGEGESYYVESSYRDPKTGETVWLCHRVDDALSGNDAAKRATERAAEETGYHRLAFSVARVYRASDES